MTLSSYGVLATVSIIWHYYYCYY